MKNILILNGSPREGGNTQLLCEALAEGVQKAGNSSNFLNICELNIKPCTGCYSCVLKKGSPCVQKDEMQKVYDAFDQADTLVFASPLYWWQFTAQMKKVIDRLFAIAAAADMNIPQKGCALVIAAQDDREENFSQIVSFYKSCLVSNLGWNDQGILLAGGVSRIGDVVNTPHIEQARKLGESL